MSPTNDPPLPVPYRPAELADMAERCAASRLFGMDPAQVFTLMLIAQAKGLHPAEALLRYHVIDGQPSMRAAAIQAEFQARGGQLRWLRTTAERCSVEAWHPALHPEHLTLHLTLAELIESHVADYWDRRKEEWIMKPAYKQYPRQMLRARAISEIVRAIDPGIVTGIYTPEEVRDFATVEDRGPMPVLSPPPIAPPVAPTGPAASPRPWAGGARARGGKRDEDEDEGEGGAEGWREFIRREVRAANDDLANAAKLDGKPVPKEPVCNGYMVINHLCSQWIDAGLMTDDDIAGPSGKRSREKAMEAVRTAFRESPHDAREDVREYVRGKLVTALEDAGLTSPGDRDEAQATADDDAPVTQDRPSP